MDNTLDTLVRADQATSDLVAVPRSLLKDLRLDLLLALDPPDAGLREILQRDRQRLLHYVPYQEA